MSSLVPNSITQACFSTKVRKFLAVHFFLFFFFLMLCTYYCSACNFWLRMKGLLVATPGMHTVCSPFYAQPIWKSIHNRWQQKCHYKAYLIGVRNRHSLNIINSAGSIKNACHEMPKCSVAPFESYGGNSQLHMIRLFAARGRCYSIFIFKNCTETAVRVVAQSFKVLSKYTISAFRVWIDFFWSSNT